MSDKKRIFISSVQKEFAVERRALKDFILGDPLLSRFFEVFLFEVIPAADRRANEVYLGEVDRCDVYVELSGRIANTEYQQLLGVAKRTAHRDLSELVDKGLFDKVGTRGKGAFYKLHRKGP